jgi:hypothetical protein
MGRRRSSSFVAPIRKALRRNCAGPHGAKRDNRDLRSFKGRRDIYFDARILTMDHLCPDPCASCAVTLWRAFGPRGREGLGPWRAPIGNIGRSLRNFRRRVREPAPAIFTTSGLPRCGGCRPALGRCSGCGAPQPGSAAPKYGAFAQISRVDSLAGERLLKFRRVDSLAVSVCSNFASSTALRVSVCSMLEQSTALR